MPDIVYNQARLLFGTGGINLISANVALALCDATYAPTTADQWMSSVPPTAIAVRDVILSSPSVRADGVFRGVIPQINALSWPNPIVGMLLYSKQLTDAVSPLLYYSSGGVGFPFVAAGLNYQIGYDQANGGFFQS